MTVPLVIVDGANVVGSRPDGWWNDRPGAASRLHAQLQTIDLDVDQVVLVLEGYPTQAITWGMGRSTSPYTHQSTIGPSPPFT